MIETNGIEYEVIGIAFPGTDAFKIEYPFANSNGRDKPREPINHYFGWGNFEVKAFPKENQVAEKIEITKLNTKAILQKGENKLKAFLDTLKPGIQRLHRNNYHGLNGIYLAFDQGDLVGPMDNTTPAAHRPLEMLDALGKRGYSNLYEDLRRLATYNKSLNFDEKEMNCLLDMSELSKRIVDYKFKKWLGKDWGHSSINNLDNVYRFELPLKIITR